MTKKIEALHEFHDPDFAQSWADRFVPTPPRIALFRLMIEELKRLSLPEIHIMELGIGPGYLALEVLQEVAGITYEGVDFSEAMFKIAEKRLAAFREQVTYTQLDLTETGWDAKLHKRPTAIISTWALHDLGSPAYILSVYEHARKLLPEGGLLLNGDFIKPENTVYEYEAGRIPIAEHLALLKQAGFEQPQCLAYLEPNAEAPTPANNYACFAGYV